MNRNQLITELNIKGTGIEIGVQDGNFSRVILARSELYMYLLDSWRYFPSDYPDAANVTDEQHMLSMAYTLATLRKFDGRFTLIRDLSENGSKLFKEEFFDFIYIDANHTYDAVITDLSCWFPKLKKGGVIAGHDYLDKLPTFEVKSAVQDFFKGKNLIINSTDERWPTWYIKT